ncbi:hypothetical protein [Bacillus sp. V3-13]|nr:hypothetical protein [Bacillus sp. V3-13]
MRTRTRKRETLLIDDIKYALTTVLLHVTFYSLIIFILLFFMEWLG